MSAALLRRHRLGTGCLSDVRRGYYLVRESDRQRFFVSEGVSLTALESTASRVLSDALGWNYWIDRCLGLDVHGRAAWVNLDVSDHFNL